MTMLKIALICVFSVMQCVYAVQGKKKKNTLFSTYCAFLLLLSALPFRNV